MLDCGKCFLTTVKYDDGNWEALPRREIEQLARNPSNSTAMTAVNLETSKGVTSRECHLAEQSVKKGGGLVLYVRGVNSTLDYECFCGFYCFWLWRFGFLVSVLYFVCLGFVLRFVWPGAVSTHFTILIWFVLFLFISEFDCVPGL